MGKLVDFVNRHERAAVEAVLERAGQRLQRRLQAQQRLPRILAALAAGGQNDFVLQVLGAWGRDELSPEELLEDCEKAAAVAGIPVE